MHLADGGRQIGLFDSHSCSWTAARLQLCRPAASRQFPSVFSRISSHTNGVDTSERMPCCLGYRPGWCSKALIQSQSGMFGLLSPPNVFTPATSFVRASLFLFDANDQQLRPTKTMYLTLTLTAKGILLSHLQVNVKHDQYIFH